MFFLASTKKKVELLEALYQSSKSSLIIFSMHQFFDKKTTHRLENSKMTHEKIDDKSLWVIDDFFSDDEIDCLTEYLAFANFSRKSYGSPEALSLGEEPAYTMNGQERVLFLKQPLGALKAFYEFIGFLSKRLDAEITTLPWELCDEKGNGSPAIVVNKCTTMSQSSVLLGKHKDVNPASGISFGIKKPYGDLGYFPKKFQNGEKGAPLFLSIIIYASEKNFLEEYELGTVFYSDCEKILKKVSIKPCRIAIFESDITHSIDGSMIPATVSTWRVSIVFKMMIIPNYPEQNLKQALEELLTLTS